MVKGITYYLRKAWKKPDKKLLRERMLKWRGEEAVVRVENPLRLDRARSLGYKAKKGVFVARVKLRRGGHFRPRPVSGRMSKNQTIRRNLKMNYRGIAEQRAARSFPNCEVLNSYWIGKDGYNFYFEVIIVDRNDAGIKHDKQLSFLTRQHGRVYHGVTSAGAKSRGLRSSTITAPKVRPSGRANKRLGT